MSGETDTIAKRAKLPARKNPYWLGIGGGRGGLSLGYRKGAKGPGKWVAKIVLDRQRLEEKLGVADDDGAPGGALSYKAAVVTAIAWSTQQHAAIEARSEHGDDGGRPTVRSAVETYSKARVKRSASDGANATSRLMKHVLSDAKFAETPMSKLKARTILDWRNRLESTPDPAVGAGLAPASINRLMNDLRAALNANYEVYRRELPAYVPAEIRIGTRAVAVVDQARQQLLSDAMVRAAVEAANDVEEDGHFGRLVLLAAATGARYSQLAKLRVGHVQTALGRVLIPGSNKGSPCQGPSGCPSLRRRAGETATGHRGARS